jgi:hypothetical protein
MTTLSKDKNILQLEKREIQQKAHLLIDYQSRFLDLLNHYKLDGGTATYYTNITSEPENEDKRGKLPGDINPSGLVVQKIKLDKVAVYRDVVNEDEMELSYDDKKTFIENITKGMFNSFAVKIDSEIVDILCDKDNYHASSVKEEEAKVFTGLDLIKDDNNILEKINKLTDNCVLPNKENNKSELLSNSESEKNLIMVIDPDLFNLIVRKYPNWRDFFSKYKAVIKYNLKNKFKVIITDYYNIQAPYGIKKYEEWYYGIDGTTHMKLKIMYNVSFLFTKPAGALISK